MVKKKSSKKKVVKKKAVAVKKSAGKKITWNQLFVKVLLLVVFVYGLYIILDDFTRWGDGLAIISGVLVVIIILKLISKFRKRK